MTKMEDILPQIVYWCDDYSSVLNLLCVCKQFRFCITDTDLTRNQVKRLISRYGNVQNAWIRYFSGTKFDLKTVKCLLRLGADANDFALRRASEYGHLEVVRCLLDADADVHAENDKALRWASNYGHLEVVRCLLDAGADVHAENDLALRLASFEGHLEVVRCLLDAGADVHAYSDQALRWASKNGYLEVVRRLLDAGADVHARDDRALIWASENNHLEIVKILKEFR